MWIKQFYLATLEKSCWYVNGSQSPALVCGYGKHEFDSSTVYSWTIAGNVILALVLVILRSEEVITIVGVCLSLKIELI